MNPRMLNLRERMDEKKTAPPPENESYSIATSYLITCGYGSSTAAKMCLPSTDPLTAGVNTGKLPRASRLPNRSATSTRARAASAADRAEVCQGIDRYQAVAGEAGRSECLSGHIPVILV